MILIINICKERLHYYEFVKPVEDILKKQNLDFETYHYNQLTDRTLNRADKIIICGTSLKDNEFLDNLESFSWMGNSGKPLLGICGGAHVMGLIFGYKLKKKKEIGLKDLNLKKEFLGAAGKLQVYHLHNLQVLPEIFQKNNLYATLFHPEVRNKNMIEEFCGL